MSALRSAARPLARAPCPSSSRAASYARPPSNWPGKSHLRKTTATPNPLPALFAQKVVLADGSTFTAYTTAPTPATIRLTRDVTNNPLWAPGGERGVGGSTVEEGRVGRFRRMFAAEEGGEGKAAGEKKAGVEQSAFDEADFAWMSEGAKEESVGENQRVQGPKKKVGKGKK